MEKYQENWTNRNLQNNRKISENWKYGNYENRKWENTRKIWIMGTWKKGTGNYQEKLKVWKLGKRKSENIKKIESRKNI